MSKGTCTSTGCDRPVRCRGLCQGHYDQARRAGQQMPPAREKYSGICPYRDCTRPLKARGLCAVHYNAERNQNGKPCSVIGCPRPNLARGWCRQHYNRWKQYGDPEATRVWGDLDPGIAGHRLCTGCLEVKSFEEFNERIARGVGKYHSRCRGCVADEWQLNRDRNLAAKAALNYGITVEQYEELMRRDRCDVCGRQNTQSGRRLHIDHCHETNVVRGVLCHSCNTALGLAEDSPERLRALAEYVERARSAV